jgi:hypothetical protein
MHRVVESAREYRGNVADKMHVMRIQSLLDVRRATPSPRRLRQSSPKVHAEPAALGVPEELVVTPDGRMMVWFRGRCRRSGRTSGRKERRLQKEYADRFVFFARRTDTRAGGVGFRFRLPSGIPRKKMEAHHAEVRVGSSRRLAASTRRRSGRNAHGPMENAGPREHKELAVHSSPLEFRTGPCWEAVFPDFSPARRALRRPGQLRSSSPK